jgi:hypothetical protein
MYIFPKKRRKQIKAVCVRLENWNQLSQVEQEFRTELGSKVYATNIFLCYDA